MQAAAAGTQLAPAERWRHDPQGGMSFFTQKAMVIRRQSRTSIDGRRQRGLVLGLGLIQIACAAQILS